MTGFDSTWLVLFGGLAATMSMGVIALAGDGGGKRVARRLETIRGRHAELSREAQASAQMRRIISTRHESAFESFARQFVPRPALLRTRLERTGRKWSVGSYAVASLVVAATTTVPIMVFGAPFLLAALIGSFLGLALPHMVVNSLIARRARKFTASFPDAMDLLVRGLRSGLPVSESLGVVGREIPGPVGIEFRIIADKIRIGRTMEDSLQEAATRINTPEFQFFVITLVIQRETGGNLAETLNNLGEVLRKRSQMKLKIKAMSSESKASAYIVGSLPFLVFGLVYWANPTYLGAFFTDTRLMIAGGCGLGWMSLGVYIMARMVSFEI